jgi:LysM repeat protein
LNTPLPFANGTRDDCTHYFNGDDYQFNLTGTKWRSNCELAIEVYRVDTESFQVWNSGLADVSLPDCTFKTGVRYCGSWYFEKDEVISNIATDVPSSTRTTGPPPSSVDSHSTITMRSSPTTASSIPSASPTVTIPPAQYMQSGQPANCVMWDRAVSGDGCWALANRNSITVTQLAVWNPVLGTDGATCSINFWLDYYYCIAVSD